MGYIADRCMAGFGALRHSPRRAPRLASPAASAAAPPSPLQRTAADAPRFPLVSSGFSSPGGRDILKEVSRTPGHLPTSAKRDDEWGRTQGSGIFVGGRLVLNLWRILRSEVNLQSHAFEASAAAVLRKRRAREPPYRTPLRLRSLARWRL